MGVTSILSALVAQASAATAPPPPGAEYLPLRAVDHVVIMEERRADCANCVLHRRTIARSGSWVKDERVDGDGVTTIYSEFVSGTSVTLYRNHEGAIERLLVERNFEPNGIYGVRRQATGQLINGLAEPCEIWTLTTTLFRSERENCETGDGILLRVRSHGRDSTVAVSVERRSVRPEEVQPPADLFTIVRWPRFDASEADGAGGYEVVLTSRSRGDEVATVVRSQGGLRSSRQEGRRGEGLYFSAADRVASYDYHVDEQGRATRLEVGLPRLRARGAPRWEAVAGRPPQRLLGESCTWQDDGIGSTDILYECRTADGVPLMLEYDWHWDSTVDIYLARSVVRRPLTEADLAPPAEAIQWATWGVTPPGP